MTREPGGSLEDAIEAFENHKHDMSASWRAQIRKALYPLRDGYGWNNR